MSAFSSPKLLNKTLVFASIFAALGLWAAERPKNSWGLLGVTGSYNTLTSSVTTESDKKGYGFGLKGVVSTYFDKMILDGSLGWNISKITGTLGSKETEISTQSGIAEGDLRFSFGNRLSLGPTAQLHFGTDQSYAEIVSDDTNWAVFGGLHLNYDIPSKDLLMRVGSKLVGDLTVPDRRIFIVFLDFQIGIPLFDDTPKKTKPVEEKPKPEEEPPMALNDLPIDPPRAEVKDLGNRKMLVRLPSDQFLFDTGMSHLRKPSRLYLSALGEYLAENPQNFSRIEVTGHTDNRGRRKMNQELSTARAKTVRTILVEAGVPGPKISFKGMAFDEPVDTRNNAAAWRKNRRTDLVFRGVTNPQEIADKVEELNDRYGRGEYNR